MMLKVGAGLSGLAMVIGVITIDADSVIPIVFTLIGAGFLLAFLCVKWDEIVRADKEEHADVDYLLWRERHNRW